MPIRPRAPDDLVAIGGVEQAVGPERDDQIDGQMSAGDESPNELNRVVEPTALHRIHAEPVRSELDARTEHHGVADRVPAERDLRVRGSRDEHQPG